MLAVYSSLIQKDEIMNRIANDAEGLVLLSNDLVCELKILSVKSRNKNLEDSIQSVQTAEELVSKIKPMIINLRNNLNGYASSLVSHPQPEEATQDSEKNMPEASMKDENSSTPNPVDQNQLSTILEAVKALKEMRNNLPA